MKDHNHTPKSTHNIWFAKKFGLWVILLAFPRSRPAVWLEWLCVCVCVFQTEGVPTVLSTCVCHCPLQRVSITPHWGQKPFCTSCYEVSRVYRDHCVCPSYNLGVCLGFVWKIFSELSTFCKPAHSLDRPPPPPNPQPQNGGASSWAGCVTFELAVKVWTCTLTVCLIDF